MSDDENFPLATDRPQAQARQVEAEFNENQENIQNVENQENNVENESTVKTFESKTKLKVHFKGWNAVAFWKWIANDETCGICRVAFDGCCPDCKTPGDDCPLVSIQTFQLLTLCFNNYFAGLGSMYSLFPYSLHYEVA